MASLALKSGQMKTTIKGLVVVSTTLALAACVPPAEPPEPPPDEVAQGMALAIADTGFYTDIALTRVLGRHYDPAHDSWNIVACFDFSTVDGSNGTNCLDSFNAKQLDNGGWLVSVTINEVYRWRAIGLPDEASEGETGT